MYFKFFPALIQKSLRNRSTLVFSRNKSNLISPQSMKDFENALPKVLIKGCADFVHPNVVERVKKVAECSAFEKYLFCGPLTLLTFETLEKLGNVTEININQIQTVAWAAELVHSYFTILDDLDYSQEVSYWCSYDPSLIRSFIFELLRLEILDVPSYVDIVHLFNKAFLHTTVSQHLDVINRKDFENFTTERYNNIVDFKTSFHTIQLPIFLAMKLTKSVEKYPYHQIEEMCKELGRLYHMQTDYLDCYGEEADQSGIPSHSRDMQQGRCSWLAVSALKRCTPAQRIVFTACYGSKEPAHIERIKVLYDQLKMPKLYKEEKEKICDAIFKKANKERLIDDKLFVKVLDVIKDRDNID